MRTLFLAALSGSSSPVALSLTRAPQPLGMSRYHAVQEFNRGVFDYLIATDESGLEGHDRDDAEIEGDEDEPSKQGTSEQGRESRAPTLVVPWPSR